MKSFEFNLPVSIFKEGETFVAYTPALDISTHGDSLEEAKKQFSELVRIFIQELEQTGKTDEVLQSLGWQKVDHLWQAPIEVDHSIEPFDIPVNA